MFTYLRVNNLYIQARNALDLKDIRHSQMLINKVPEQHIIYTTAVANSHVIAAQYSVVIILQSRNYYII